jgi:hypothetical protein
MRSPFETQKIAQIQKTHQPSEVRLLSKGQNVNWRGLRCTVRAVHLVWLTATHLSWTASYYVMYDLSSTFNVSLAECHFG